MTTHHGVLGRGAVALLTVSLLSTCSKEPTAPPASVAATISVSPASASLEAIGDTARFSAIVADQNGKQMSGVSILWSVSDPLVATIDASSGIAVATAAGSVTVRAAAGSASGSAQLAVQQKATALSKVSGDTQMVAAGSALSDSLVVKVVDKRGNAVKGATIAWTVASGGGTIAPSSVVTDASGRAAARWTLGAATTSQTATATVAGLISATFVATGTNPGPGLLTGAFQFAGPYPGLETRTFNADGRQVTDTIYSGQVQLYVDSTTSAAAATATIRSAGGTVIARVPNAGYYLASVAPGTEDAWMATMRGKAGVTLVVPHGTGSFMGTTVLDQCDGTHGVDVVAAVKASGGKVDGCKQVIQPNCTTNCHPVPSLVTDEIYAAAAKGGTVMLNLSFGGGLNGKDYATQNSLIQWTSEYAWKRWMKIILQSVASLPELTRRNMVLTIAAGNGNMPLTAMLADLRSDPAIAAVLRKNVLIVTAEDQVLHLGNKAPNDPDVAVMGTATCPNGTVGTSCSAPLALGEIDGVATIVGLQGSNVLLAAKTAIATNSTHKLDTEELLDKATQLKTALTTDGANALNVTAIAFTSKGNTTSAVITPAMAGVTVAYTVSGTDGYYNSGTARTDAAGRVSFAVPAGAHGVVDTVSVTALVAGITRTETYTWP